MIEWIVNLRLWEIAQVKAAKVLPKFSRSFWQEVLKIYRNAGGKLVDEELSQTEIEEEQDLLED